MRDLERKVSYQLKTYSLPYRCVCQQCQHQVIRNYRTTRSGNGYEFLCPYCHENKFADEVNIDEKTSPARQEYEQLKQDITEHIKLKGDK